MSALLELAAADALDWFGQNRRLELYHYSPVYGDDDDQSEEWRVAEQSGSINDREWTVIGRGLTPLDAIRAALRSRAAMSPDEQRSQ